MRLLLGTLVLFLIALFGARFSFTTRRLPVGPRFLFIAGTHFLFIGALLATDEVGLLTPGVLQALYPLLALSIGWIGLLFGMQLDLRQLRAFPPGLIGLALAQAGAAFAIFALLALGLLRLAGPLDRTLEAAVLAAAATACISSPLGITLVARLVGARGRIAELLLLVSSLDAIVGITAMQLVYALYHPLRFSTPPHYRPGPEWIALAIAVGMIGAILFLWLVRSRPRREELPVFLLGLALLAAGTALYLGVSALFVTVIAGMLIANLSPFQARLYAVLQDWEKAVYVMLLVLLGAMLEFGGWLALPLAVAYAALRLLAKGAGSWVAGRLLPAAERPPASFGLALMPQSGMPLVLVLSVTMSYGALGMSDARITSTLIATVTLAVVISELLGPVLTRTVLRRHATIQPEASRA